MINHKELKKINLESLKRLDLDARLNFEAVNDVFSAIKKHLDFFEGKSINTLTIAERAAVSSIYNSYKYLLEQVSSFTQKEEESMPEVVERRGKLIEEIKKFNIKAVKTLVPLKHVVMEADNTVESLMNQTKNKLQSIDEKFDQLFQKFDKKFQTLTQNANKNIEEIESIKSEARNFSVDALVEKYGEIFKEESESNFTRAIVSLGIFIVSVIVIIIGAYFLFTPLIEELPRANVDWQKSIPSVAFRITLISIAFIVVKESLKNYNINMHLYNLNRHRHNSLLSFNTLVDTLGEDHEKEREARTTLIKQIANTIYAQNDDGFMVNSRKGLSVNQIIELLKTLKK